MYVAQMVGERRLRLSPPYRMGKLSAMSVPYRRALNVIHQNAVPGPLPQPLSSRNALVNQAIRTEPGLIIVWQYVRNLKPLRCHGGEMIAAIFFLNRGIINDLKQQK